MKGETIPIEGRIAAIADAFDALTTQRVYKPAFDLGHAITLMLKHRNEHFDPELLDVFVASADELARIHEQYADPVNPSPNNEPCSSVQGFPPPA